MLSSCYNAADGAFVGGHFGHVIGSAIGGITGGGRGHDIGALIGTVGGVAAGAVIGNAVEKSNEQKAAERYQQARERYQRTDDRYQSGNDRYQSGNDRYESGDDRIYFNNEPPLEIRNAAITESLRDGKLTAGEECSVRFEIYNTSDRPIYDIHPLVEDITGNKHVKVSPNLTIENIGPHRGVRYTATILADRKLKDGEIRVKIGVVQGSSEVTSQTQCFVVPTAKTIR